MKLNLFLLLSLLFALINTPLRAQEDNGRPDHYCGVTESHPWMDAYLAGEIGTARSSTPLALPIRFIIVGRSDGTGYANPNDVLGSMCQLNEDFAGTNLSFYIDGELDTINNTTYWDHNTSNGRLMMAQNNQSGVINVYVVGSPNGACGYYSPSRDAVAMDKDCMGYGDFTLSHEIGHYLSLRHTFFGWESQSDGGDNPFAYLPIDEPAPTTVTWSIYTVEVEKADGSNCEDAGDGFCDTDPDYLSVRWSCDVAGLYPDSLLDSDGNAFIVNGRNIMSYSSDVCVDTFSFEQIAAMETNANDRTSLHTGEVADNDLVPEVVQISPNNGETLDAFDYAELRWEAADNADFYVVELNNTQFFNGAVFRRYVVFGTVFAITEDLIANRNYYWRVRGVNKHDPCADNGEFSDIRRFRNGTISSVIDPPLDAAIDVFPNPLSSNERALFIQATDLPSSGELQYQLINTTGQVIRSRYAGLVAASGFRETIDVGGLPQGMYFLRILIGDRLLTRRVVLNR